MSSPQAPSVTSFTDILDDFQRKFGIPESNSKANLEKCDVAESDGPRQGAIGRKHLRALQTKASVLTERDVYRLGKKVESASSQNRAVLTVQHRSTKADTIGASLLGKYFASCELNAVKEKKARAAEVGGTKSTVNRDASSVWERRISRLRAATNRFASRDSSLGVKNHKTAREQSVPLAPPALAPESGPSRGGRSGMLKRLKEKITLQREAIDKPSTSPLAACVASATAACAAAAAGGIAFAVPGGGYVKKKVGCALTNKGRSVSLKRGTSKSTAADLAQKENMPRNVMNKARVEDKTGTRNGSNGTVKGRVESSERDAANFGLYVP